MHKIKSIEIMKKWKNTSSYGLYKTRYHNCSYLVLLGKRNLPSFEISCEKFLLLWNKPLSLLNAVPQSFKIK